MKKITLLFVLFLFFAQLSHTSNILPEPKSYVQKNVNFKIISTTKIVLGNDTPVEQFIAQQLNDELIAEKDPVLGVVGEKSRRKIGTNFIFLGKPTSEYGKLLLEERKGKLTAGMKAEGYFLDVTPKGVVVIAENDKGLFYGMMSLLQLLKNEGRSLVVQGATIHDFPSQKVRGITDDVSRGQISTVENFKKIIRFCAQYKMNTYSPYMEDVFLFKKYPEIGKNRGALSAKEWKELDEYGRKYFVEVIPIFQTLGHWENILLHPEYVALAEFPGAHTLNVSDEKVYAMLDEMIGEVSSSFSSPYFNIAADESWDVGLGVNKPRVAKSDLATVHSEHYKRIFEIVKKYGKKPMMYGDIILNHPDILKKIPPEVTIVDWQYGARFDYPSPEVFKEAGFPFIISPAVWNFTGPFPNYINTFINIQYLNLDGYNNGSQGMLCSNWNDFGGEALRELNYYGFAWNAECAWNPTKAEQTTFNDKFFKNFFNDEQNEIRSVYLTLINPANQFHWYELWRHPMLPNRDDMIWEKRLPLIQRMQSIQSSMPYVLSRLERMKNGKIKNADHLHYLSFIAKLNLWFATKVEAQEKIKLMLKDTTTSKEELKTRIVSLCTRVTEELSPVRYEFEKVWMMTNKAHNIDRLLQRYDRQTAYWNEFAERIQSGNFSVDVHLQSQWLYHPQANPNVKDSAQIQRSYFRTVIPVDKRIASAKIQLLGDTWSKLYVNGIFVGEIYARRSLSLLVEMDRAKIFDVTKLMNDSLNVIAVESQNFNQNGSAGMNVFGEIIFTDGATQPIISDYSWLVSETADKDWSSLKFNASSWLQAAPKKYSVPVVAPNLKTGRTSWFER